ncbi:MFS transporter [Sporolactobacillus shoreicorticis]|uniref:MFS transporter n=1 Tax=Sporolactobacillus shoreicorticis TaxID=1923877 RepID=A0ABW5SAW4_9BACL|nr:MFS transporter [Sporolactobacillus shoreicorticis]MCO7126889.1 MFS transporter [Sporolactobacillus shoreicorticis]
MEKAEKEQVIAQRTFYGVLFAIGCGHFFNDSIQAVIPAMNPILEQTLNLNYAQIGWIAFVANMTASVIQPFFGYYADIKSKPFLLPVGILTSLVGLIIFALAPSYVWALFAVFFIGIGSSIFHPEGSRVAHMAAGAKRGLAQSIFQVGGNFGQSMAPVLTALIFLPFGQRGVLSFSVFAFIGMIVLFFVSVWYKNHQTSRTPREKHTQYIKRNKREVFVHKRVVAAMVLLIFIIFARSWYSTCISNFYQFYLIHDYGLSIPVAQLFIFIFMVSGVVGTFLGGPLADRFGKKTVILGSFVGAVPLTVMLPYLPLYLIAPVFLLIGLIITSSFSVTVIYAQELMPGRLGMVSGLTIGFAFGMGAIGAVLFGNLADLFSIRFVMILCSLFPLVGLFSALLPGDMKIRRWNKETG